jgi:nicotinate-nucleotide pyrophosphorylase
VVEHPEVVRAVRLALEEDLGSGDLTTLACVDEGRMAAGSFLAREPLVVAGIELLPLIYQQRGGVTELRLEKSRPSSKAARARCSNASGSRSIFCNGSAVSPHWRAGSRNR